MDRSVETPYNVVVALYTIILNLLVTCSLFDS